MKTLIVTALAAVALVMTGCSSKENESNSGNKSSISKKDELIAVMKAGGMAERDQQFYLSTIDSRSDAEIDALIQALKKEMSRR